MARKKAVRRENGRGTVEKTNSKKNPFTVNDISVGTLTLGEQVTILRSPAMEQPLTIIGSSFVIPP